MEKYLVTGAGGFTGSYLVDALIKKGLSVRALVRNQEQFSKLKEKGVDVVLGDIRSEDDLRIATKDIYGVFHIAALFRQAKLPDSEYFAVNRDAVDSLFRISIENGVKRIVHCSTNGVHTSSKNPPITEESPFSTGDLYQESKLQGELIAQRWYKSGKIKGAIIRPGMVYGPGDDRIGKLFKMIAKKRFFYIGNGLSEVQWIDVRDLANAFILAMENESLEGDAFLIAGERVFTLKEFCTLVANVLNVPPPWIHIPVMPMKALGLICEILCKPFGIEPPIYRRRVDFFTKRRWFDISKAKRVLGFCPAQTVLGEIKDIIEWYQKLGLIKGPVKKSGKATFIRDQDGKIVEWDKGAEKLYEISESVAKGQACYSMLKTIFPEPLEQINKHLSKEGKWGGELVQTNLKSERFFVKSTWELIGNNKIRETNEAI